jgi:hypothetical protein
VHIRCSHSGTSEGLEVFHKRTWGGAGSGEAQEEPRSLAALGMTRYLGTWEFKSTHSGLALCRCIILQLPIKSCLAYPQQARGLQFVAMQLRDGVEDGQLFQLCNGNDLVLAVAVSI